MNKMTPKRMGELVRAVLELLWNKPAGLRASEVIAFIPQIVPLSDYERDYAPLSNMPRYERYIRVATIPLEKAGWISKSKKGRWLLTEEGKEACLSYQSAAEFYEAAVRQFEDIHFSKPVLLAEAEKAEEKAWEQIQDFVKGLNRREFLVLVGDLFESMGYHIVWAAPPGKEHGQIDLIVSKEPLGVGNTRVFVHVHHGEHPVNLKNVQTFTAAIHQLSYGVMVSRSGFENGLQGENDENMQGKVYFIDLETFFDLWIKHFSSHDTEAMLRFPLKIVYFLAGPSK